jgi:hypothetical protein
MASACRLSLLLNAVLDSTAQSTDSVNGCKRGDALNWFERITGFPETDYEETQSRLELRGTRLRSKVNRKEHEIGEFVMPTLAELRQEVDAGSGNRGVLKVSLETGDVRKFLLARENRGALFQVASQFNMLEMTGPSVTPEDGVTRYQLDPTQGPACAVAAGAATIYRNYLVPVDGVQGQRADRQLDGLSDLGAELSRLLGKPIPELWGMRNGYALCTSTGLAAIDALLEIAGEPELDEMRSLLRIGLHRNVQVTEILGAPPHLVSQAFCSALPVAYSDIPSEAWTRLAQLVLDAAYEATLLESVLNARRGASNIVFLTRLGGGAFGNQETWIHAAMARALELVKGYALDVRIVSYNPPSPRLQQLVAEFSST